MHTANTENTRTTSRSPLIIVLVTQEIRCDLFFNKIQFRQQANRCQYFFTNFQRQDILPYSTLFMTRLNTTSPVCTAQKSHRASIARA
tara:strand:- start:1885 stop:2148 length:264 start_codon:yes stop_codon:yes gene_type:complete